MACLPMSKKAVFSGLFLLVICTALIMRLVQLDLRPMHHDEANQAVKFGDLLENGEYRYDPMEHHGPTLYYCTLPFAWIGSGTSYASLSEKTLRLVPAVFGVGIVLLLLLLKGGFSRPGIVFSGIFAAISPVMVFYSRFYIQETLLVFFLLGAMAAGWRYHVERKWGWAAATGFFCGMMYATKETCIIAFGALFLALLLARLFEKEVKFERPLLSHGLVLLGSGLLSSFLLFTSFFRSPQGILDSVLSFQSYFTKAGGAGFHVYPWYYYLKMLGLSQYETGPVWSEAFILILALVGCVAVFLPDAERDSHPLFLRFVCFFTLLSTAAYSLIPYKTPWNMLPFYIGVILMAGNGAVFVFRANKKIFYRGIVFLMLCAGIFHLGVQSYRANFKYPADTRNPYVYAHTSMDFLNLVERINDIARYHPGQNSMLIKVVTVPDEAWPLPWYLRDFSQVGYWTTLDEVGELGNVPIIISSIDKTKRLEPDLQDTHQTEFYGLRPEVLLALHIRKDLWEKFLESRR